MKFDPRLPRVLSRAILCKTGLVRSGKVFCIGFGRTGTISLHRLFLDAGRLSIHDVHWREPGWTWMRLSHDCFCDGPPLPDLDDFIRLDRSFPGSKFILNVRELTPWLVSRISLRRRQLREGHDYKLPGWEETPEAIKTWIRHRNAYHIAVLRHFRTRPADLLVVNFVRDKAAAPKIAAFAGLPDVPAEKPHFNSIAPDTPEHSDRDEISAIVSGILDDLKVPEAERMLDLFCPSLADPAVVDGLPRDSVEVSD